MGNGRWDAPEGVASGPAIASSHTASGPLHEQAVGVLLSRAEDDTGFGFRLAVVHDPVGYDGYGVVVTHVTPDGPADVAGLVKGDQIVRLNGLDIRNANCEEVANVLGVVTSTLLVHTLPNNALLTDFEREKVAVMKQVTTSTLPAPTAGGGITLARGSNGSFGLAFRDHPKQGTIHIANVIPGGAAWHDGRIQRGMEVTDLNGIDIEGYTVDTVAQMLIETAPDGLTLGLASDGYRHVSLDAAGAGKLGLVLGGPADANAVRRAVRGVFIASVIPNSVAASVHRNGELEIGHQLLQINGIATTSMTLAEAQPLLEGHQPSSVMKLATAPNTLLRELYTDLPPVHLRRGAVGYGLTLAGPLTAGEVERRCHGVLIASHTPPVSGVVPLQRGLQIVGVNGQDTTDLSVHHVKELIQFHTEAVTLDVRHNSLAVQTYLGTGGPREVGTDSSTCVIHREGGSYGLEFNGARSRQDATKHGVGVFVAGVKPGSPASRAAGLHVGWQVVRLNGMDMRLATVVELQTALAHVGSTLTMHLEPNNVLFSAYQQLTSTIQGSSSVSRQAMRASTFAHGAESEAAPEISVTLERPPNGGYGLLFGGPKDSEEANRRGYGIFISGVRGNSVAASVAEIQIGMQIVNLNGVDLTKATFEDMRALLQRVGDKMTLVLRENLDLIQPYRKADYRGQPLRSSLRKVSRTMTVTLQRAPGGGFGLKFGGPRTSTEGDKTGYGIFISGTTPGSVADQHKELPIGWQILAMNDEDLLDATFVDMKQALERVGDTMVLKLTENEPLRVTYTKLKNAALRSSLRRHSMGDEATAAVTPPTEEVTVPGAPGPTGADTAEVPLTGGSEPPPPADTTTTDEADVSHPDIASEVATTMAAPAATEPASDNVPAPVEEEHDVVDTTEEDVAHGTAGMSMELNEITAQLERGPTGYGLLFGGARNKAEGEKAGFGVFISGVKPNSVAAESPDIMVGWEIVSINDTPLRMATFEEMKAVLSSVGETMTLVLRDNEALREAYTKKKKKKPVAIPPTLAEEASQAEEQVDDATKTDDADSVPEAPSTEVVPVVATPESQEDVVECVLERDEKGFGLKFGGPKTDEDGEANGFGIFVSGVKPGSVAEKSDTLHIGWQIIEFNGANLSKGTFAGMKDLLGKVEKKMVLKLRQNEALRRAYVRKKKSS
eukprot:m.7532 g.7532  ORF g.7532 m.7532 type:complete len:1177 (-) comp2453_c0_seq1:87-3617(-)